MFNYKNYWDNRYKFGGNSGAGSYGDNAVFKAKFLNSFVKEHNIDYVIDFGCGDGNNTRLFNFQNYLGLDVSPEAISICKQKFKGDKSKNFEIIDIKKNYRASLCISLDVTYHIFGIVERAQYIEKVISSSSRYSIFYSFPHPNDFAKHLNDYDFHSYICRRGAVKLDLDNPGSISKFYLLDKNDI